MCLVLSATGFCHYNPQLREGDVMPKCLNFWAQNAKEKEIAVLCLPIAVNQL